MNKWVRRRNVISCAEKHWNEQEYRQGEDWWRHQGSFTGPPKRIAPRTLAKVFGRFWQLWQLWIGFPNFWTHEKTTAARALYRGGFEIRISYANVGFNCLRNGKLRLLLGVEDTADITKENRPTNLLFSLFTSFFYPFVLCCFTSAVPSTPSKSPCTGALCDYVIFWPVPGWGQALICVKKWFEAQISGIL